MAVMARETWTDERLDDLSKRSTTASAESKRMCGKSKAKSASSALKYPCSRKGPAPGPSRCRRAGPGS